MSPRHRLANRRPLETHSIDFEEQRYKIGIGRDVASSKVMEVFISAQKPNSPIDALVSDGAILMSLLLQHGCPIETIHHAMKRNPDGSSSSPLGRAAALIAESTSQGE